MTLREAIAQSCQTGKPVKVAVPIVLAAHNAIQDEIRGTVQDEATRNGVRVWCNDDWTATGEKLPPWTVELINAAHEREAK